MEYPLAKQDKSRTAKHHSFDEFNPGHLTLCLSVAVNKH
jgi:hypothetical protein